MEIKNTSKTFCIFSAMYLPHIGGVERYTYNLAKQLEASGHKVIIATSSTRKMQAIEINNNIKIYRLPCINLLNGRFPVLKLNSELIKLKRKMKKEGIDYVLINTRFYIHSLFGLQFARSISAKSAVIEHGSAHLTIGSWFWDSVGHIYEHFITSIVKLYAKDFIGVSAACNQWLQHFGIKANGVFYNAVDLEEINKLNASPVRNFRNEYSISPDTIVIAYAGRLIPEKGIRELIQAYKLLEERGMNVKLLLAGAGPLAEEIKTFESENIILIGTVSFPEVIALFSQSDISTAPSYSEGFPTSVLESAACGCFCIASKQGGAKELIKDENYGLIVDEITPKAIAEAIYKAANDEKYRKSAAQKAQEMVRDNFHWGVTAKKIEEYFKT